MGMVYSAGTANCHYLVLVRRLKLYLCLEVVRWYLVAERWNLSAIYKGVKMTIEASKKAIDK